MKETEARSTAKFFVLKVLIATFSTASKWITVITELKSDRKSVEEETSSKHQEKVTLLERFQTVQVTKLLCEIKKISKEMY